MHLLIIEDDLALGAALQKALNLEGMSSTWFRRCVDLTHAPDDAEYDCVLLDLTLPDGSGMDLMRRWRSTGTTLPMIIITARTALEDRLDGLDRGADDFIVKPFATAELVSRIRAVVRRAARQSSDVWEFGDLRIEPHRHVVSNARGSIDLSLREFQLLMELARNYGNVVAKSNLAQRLNPLGDPLDYGAIEVHISNLRRKIGVERISTVRGVGYMLKP